MRKYRPKMTTDGRPPSMRDLELAHPGSVWCSLVTRANWISNLDISRQAKRLTRLQGRFFKRAVERIIARDYRRALRAANR